MRRRLLFAVVLLALGLAVPAVAKAAPQPTAPVFNQNGRLIQTPFVPPPKVVGPHLSKQGALQIVERNPKAAGWLARYPAKGRSEDETYDKTTQTWTVKILWGDAGEIVEATVLDPTGQVTTVYTGPQVAWGMARGTPGAFGGTAINNPWIWMAFCAVFFFGLADLKRPLSLRNLDLLFLLSPTASLWYFNHGDVFTAVPLFYPCLFWVVLRGIWIGTKNRGTPGAPRWPVWVLIGATIFLAGFRVGLNVERSNVIDVGYSGVIGAERIVTGQAPWGNFPVDQLPSGKYLKSCPGTDTEVRRQTNGHCERSNPQGDTYGPTAYEAYIPGYLIFGWSRRWDSLPSVHFTAIAFDLLTILGLWFVGLRFGGRRLGAVLAFAWAAYPFTQYVSQSNTNDAIMPCLLVWAFWLLSAPIAGGVLAAASGWTKFASLIVAPLWLTYPAGRISRRFAAGFVLGTLAVFSILLLDPRPLHEVVVFWHRTFGYQVGRQAPWSLWDWVQYHARGLPDLHLVQRVLQGLLVIGALLVAVVPRRKSPLQLVAFTAVLLAGFETVQTYWLYTYIPWFYPFAALTLLAPATPLRKLVEQPSGGDPDWLDRLRPSRFRARHDDALQPGASLGGLEADG